MARIHYLHLKKQGLIIARCGRCHRPWARFRLDYSVLNNRGGADFCDACFEDIIPQIEAMLAVKVACAYCESVINQSDDRSKSRGGQHGRN